MSGRSLFARRDYACMLYARYVWYHRSRFLMHSKVQHIVVVLLVCSYVFVGAAAHFDAFSHLFGFGTDPHKVAQTNPTQPAPTKVYWTQYKHIPAVTKSLPASLAVVSSFEFPRLQRYGLLPAPFEALICPMADISTVSSRAPPESPAVS